MAVLQGNYYSQALNQDTHFVFIRHFEGRPEGAPEKYLILLHGLMDNSPAWLYKTNLYRLAEEYGVSIFCPEGHRSFYLNMAYGPKYSTLVLEEIPKVMKSLFGIELNSENTVIAGNSMGGYGALKAVLSPDSLYKKCMAFSPVIDPLKSLEVIPGDFCIPGEEKALYGMDVKLDKADDLYALAAEAAGKDLQITMTCGWDDFLLEQNRSFRDFAEEKNLPVTYREAAGEHGWEYWETHLRELFEEFFRD